MKITILNGSPSAENKDFDLYLEKLSSSLKIKENNVFIFKLRDMKLNNCIGCYSCWLKTPGICIHKDDLPKVLKEYLASDLVVFASPVLMGFVSALLKRFQERLLPMSHPFLQLLNDRIQHVSRYENYPATALLLEKPDDFDNDSFQIIDKVFKSAKTKKFLFTKFTDKKPEEVADEFNAI
jgi:multimeric flavodoxin WrbA